MTPLPGAPSSVSAATSEGGAGGHSKRRSRVLLVAAALAAVGAAGVAYRHVAAQRAVDDEVEDGRFALGWGEGISRPDHTVVRMADGAELAVWDLAGDGSEAPVVVLPHCWGCSHEVWLPVARRLRGQGFRVVLYDQRGHGISTRGTSPLTIETLAHDLTAVLEATDVHEVVLAGHSMGGMTIMSHLDLTRDLFGSCHGSVRGDFLLSISTMDLLEGVGTIQVPTTVMVGTRDALTLPKKADQIVATVPGARLVTLQNRGHMLPLEDPDAVTDEIVRAVKG
jgi:pimeloyl-ACP methyl ester carboxylesterase